MTTATKAPETDAAPKDSPLLLVSIGASASDLAANVPGSVFQCSRTSDGEWKLTFISQGAQEMFGHTPEEIMATPSLLPALVHPEDIQALRARIHDATERGAALEIEHRILLPDGQVKWLHTRSTPQSMSDGSMRWNGVSVDITRRKTAEDSLTQAENRYLNILNRAPALIWRSGLDAKCDWFNQTWLDVTGRTMEQELGDGWAEGVHPDDRARCTAIYHEAFHARRRFKMDYRLRRHDGQYIWITDEGVPLFDLNGQFAGFIGYGFDVTERAEAAEQVQQMMAMTENASRIKSEFLANMSHEIRTPLNGMLGMLQLLDMTDLTEEQKDYVLTSLESGKNLLNMINEILDLSKIESGKMDLEERRFNLGRVVELAGKTFYPLALAKGIRLDWQVNAPIDIPLIGDQGRLTQVLSSIIGNAVKFTEQGEVHVLAASMPVATDPGRLKLSFAIRDTGIGIPHDKMESVFEPFTQVDGSGTRRYSGTGLGLTIAKRLVELMDGTISLESEAGNGTTVRFSVMVRSSVEPQQFAGQGRSHQAATPKRSLHVLVVEDDTTNQSIITKMLAKFGNTSAIASNRDEAMALLAEEDFDFILMDIQLPGPDGFTITNEIRTSQALGLKSSIPIVALTAMAMSGDREKCLQAGMDGYLSKPIEVEELKQVLLTIISKITGTMAPAVSWE